ncbi:MAG: hypothetical protein KJ697_01630 [Nanoarchaeota archaeon]|nr:hypothetical protein [Nanoarchaeota archaeon]MBU4124007.1 hypothetical protein [Nanoarchaeota archaeon]
MAQKTCRVETIQVSINQRNFKGFLDLPIIFEKGEKNIIASIPIYNVAVQGRTQNEAKKNLREAVEVFFEGEIGKELLLQKIKLPNISVHLKEMNFPMPISKHV